MPRSDKAQPGAPGLKIVSEKSHAQLTERDLRAIVAEFVQPLHAEVVALKEKRRRETASAAASIFRCHIFLPRWKRNCGYVCAKTWGHKC